MDIALLLHGVMARAIVMYLTVIGGWGIVSGARGRGPSGAFLGALMVGVGVCVVQGLLGLVAFLRVGPREPLHVLYGFALVLALPLAWTYARGRPGNRVSLFLGFASLFAAGLAIRGMTTS